MASSDTSTPDNRGDADDRDEGRAAALADAAQAGGGEREGLLQKCHAQTILSRLPVRERFGHLQPQPAPGRHRSADERERDCEADTRGDDDCPASR